MIHCVCEDQPPDEFIVSGIFHKFSVPIYDCVITGTDSRGIILRQFIESDEMKSKF